MNKRLNKIKRLYESVSKNSYKKFTLKESKLNEDKGFPFISDEFSQREFEIAKPIIDKFPSKEDQLKELKRQRDEGEITDQEYRYVNHYWDTLALSVKEDSTDKKEIKDHISLYDTVYNNLFSYTTNRQIVTGGGKDMQRYDSGVTSTTYFDPEEIGRDKFSNIDFDKYDCIGIKSDTLKRAEAVAKEFGLDTVYGKSGKTIILLIPKEYSTKSYVDWKRAKRQGKI